MIMKFGTGMKLDVVYIIVRNKVPVKLIQRVKIAHFIFSVCVKSVPLCHFRLAFVVLHMAGKEFFESHI